MQRLPSGALRVRDLDSRTRLESDSGVVFGAHDGSLYYVIYPSVVRVVILFCMNTAVCHQNGTGKVECNNILNVLSLISHTRHSTV